MADTTHTPGIPLNEQNKGSDSKTELQRFFELLRMRPLTCTQACVILGIPQKHLTWPKRRLEKAGLLAVVNKGYCPVTRRIAQFLTTDPARISKIHPQTSLFA